MQLDWDSDDDENCVNDDDDEYLYMCKDNSITIISVLLKGWIGRPANIC